MRNLRVGGKKTATKRNMGRTVREVRRLIGRL